MIGLTEMGWCIGALVALAIAGRVLRLHEGRIASPEQACRRAERALVGFEARRALVSQDGAAALVGGNGTVAVLKREGAKVVAGRLIPPIRYHEVPEGVAVETGARLFGDVLLFGVTDADVEKIVPRLSLV